MNTTYCIKVNRFSYAVLLVACLFALITEAATTTLKIPLTDFGTNPSTNRTVWITPMSAPTASSVSVVIGDKVIRTTDSSGVCYVSNINIGLFAVAVQAPPQRTDFKVLITTNDIGGTVNAHSNLVADSTATFPAGNVAWSAASQDLRYALRGQQGGITNFDAGSNAVYYTGNGTNYIAAELGKAEATNIAVAAASNATNGIIFPVTGMATNGGTGTNNQFTQTTLRGNTILFSGFNNGNFTNQGQIVTKQIAGLGTGSGSMMLAFDTNAAQGGYDLQLGEDIVDWANLILSVNAQDVIISQTNVIIHKSLNIATNVEVGGAFFGNGYGLTNLPAAAITNLPSGNGVVTNGGTGTNNVFVNPIFVAQNSDIVLKRGDDLPFLVQKQNGGLQLPQGFTASGESRITNGLHLVAGDLITDGTAYANNIVSSNIIYGNGIGISNVPGFTGFVIESRSQQAPGQAEPLQVVTNSQTDYVLKTAAIHNSGGKGTNNTFTTPTLSGTTISGPISMTGSMNILGGGIIAPNFNFGALGDGSFNGSLSAAEITSGDNIIAGTAVTAPIGNFSGNVTAANFVGQGHGLTDIYAAACNFTDGTNIHITYDQGGRIGIINFSGNASGLITSIPGVTNYIDSPTYVIGMSNTATTARILFDTNMNSVFASNAVYRIASNGYFNVSGGYLIDGTNVSSGVPTNAFSGNMIANSNTAWVQAVQALNGNATNLLSRGSWGFTADTLNAIFLQKALNSFGTHKLRLMWLGDSTGADSINPIYNMLSSNYVWGSEGIIALSGPISYWGFEPGVGIFSGLVAGGDTNWWGNEFSLTNNNAMTFGIRNSVAALADQIKFWYIAGADYGTLTIYTSPSSSSNTWTLRATVNTTLGTPGLRATNISLSLNNYYLKISNSVAGNQGRSLLVWPQLENSSSNNVSFFDGHAGGLNASQLYQNMGSNNLASLITNYNPDVIFYENTKAVSSLDSFTNIFNVLHTWATNSDFVYIQAQEAPDPATVNDPTTGGQFQLPVARQIMLSNAAVFIDLRTPFSDWTNTVRRAQMDVNSTPSDIHFNSTGQQLAGQVIMRQLGLLDMMASAGCLRAYAPANTYALLSGGNNLSGDQNVSGTLSSTGAAPLIKLYIANNATYRIQEQFFGDGGNGTLIFNHQGGGDFLKFKMPFTTPFSINYDDTVGFSGGTPRLGDANPWQLYGSNSVFFGSNYFSGGLSVSNYTGVVKSNAWPGLNFTNFLANGDSYLWNSNGRAWYVIAKDESGGVKTNTLFAP